MSVIDVITAPVVPAEETVGTVVEQAPITEMAPVEVPIPVPMPEMIPVVTTATPTVPFVPSPASQLNEAYIDSLYKPYEEALADVVDVQSILDWIPQVFSIERTKELLEKVAGNDNVEDVRAAIKSFVVRTFFSNYNQEGVTPWSLAEYTEHEEANKLFGIGVVKEKPVFGQVPKVALPVTVVVGPTQYAHEWDQDTTYGILLGLRGNLGIKLYVAGIELNEQMLNNIYSVPAGVLPTKTLSAVFHSGRKQFDDNRLLTGYITACTWLGLDQRAMIRDLKQLSVDANGTKLFTPLSF